MTTENETQKPSIIEDVENYLKDRGLKVVETDAVKKFIWEEHSIYDGIWEFTLDGDLHRRFSTHRTENFITLEGNVSVCRETSTMKGKGVEGCTASIALSSRIAFESRHRRALAQIRDVTSVLAYEMGRGDLSLQSLEGIAAVLKGMESFLPNRG